MSTRHEKTESGSGKRREGLLQVRVGDAEKEAFEDAASPLDALATNTATVTTTTATGTTDVSTVVDGSQLRLNPGRSITTRKASTAAPATLNPTSMIARLADTDLNAELTAQVTTTLALSASDLTISWR